MAVYTLKLSFQFFGVCNHCQVISSRCLHASAVTFKNFTAREIKKKKSSLRWPDIEDTRATRGKVRERKSVTLQKSSDSTKNKIRERSVSLKNSSTSKIKVREGGSTLSKKSSVREWKAEAKVIPDREGLLKRRRAPEPVVWSARTAETILLYKDGN